MNKKPLNNVLKRVLWHVHKNFFHQGSLIADDALRQCRLTNYQTTELETRQAKERALAAVSAIVEGKPIHVIFQGNLVLVKVIWLSVF